MIFSGYEPLDKYLLKDPSIIVFYGSAGTGKTNVVFQILRCSSRAGIRGIYVSTEGVVYRNLVERWFKDLSNILFAEAINEVDLIKLMNVLSLVDLPKEFIVAIDTINSFYRLLAADDVTYAIRYLSYVMARLRELTERGVHVLLTAQIREVGEGVEREISGFKVIEFWSDKLVKVEADEATKVRSLSIKLNENESLMINFRITDRGVVWIGHEHIK
ncbi:MAG: hypothetical protein DRO18_08555 [Thermoprotei archaeon]|nr:MAG: hypothetical protein DRO18_08555 [Thermoprotei archaeon]